MGLQEWGCWYWWCCCKGAKDEEIRHEIEDEDQRTQRLITRTPFAGSESSLETNQAEEHRVDDAPADPAERSADDNDEEQRSRTKSSNSNGAMNITGCNVQIVSGDINNTIFIQPTPSSTSANPGNQHRNDCEQELNREEEQEHELQREEEERSSQHMHSTPNQKKHGYSVECTEKSDNEAKEFLKANMRSFPNLLPRSPNNNSSAKKFRQGGYNDNTSNRQHLIDNHNHNHVANNGDHANIAPQDDASSCSDTPEMQRESDGHRCTINCVTNPKHLLINSQQSSRETDKDAPDEDPATAFCSMSPTQRRACQYRKNLSGVFMDIPREEREYIELQKLNNQSERRRTGLYKSDVDETSSSVQASKTL